MLQVRIETIRRWTPKDLQGEKRTVQKLWENGSLRAIVPHRTNRCETKQDAPTKKGECSTVKNTME